MDSKNKLPAPSKEFMRAVVDESSIVIDCEFCDRTHFIGDGADYDEGEFENLIKKSELEPEKYIFHNLSSISWGRLGGKQVVEGCPCNEASKYEQLFWDSRYVIADYFSSKSKKLQGQANYEVGLAKKVKSSLKQIQNTTF